MLGRQIELVLYDDASNGQTAAGLYEKLIMDDKVNAVLGPYGSAITEAVAEMAVMRPPTSLGQRPHRVGAIEPVGTSASRAELSERAVFTLPVSDRSSAW